MPAPFPRQTESITKVIYRETLRKLNLYIFENRSIKRFSNMYKLIVEVDSLQGAVGVKRILLGTGNKTRKEFIKEILKGLPLEIVCLQDLNIRIKALEDGKDPAENSIKKARTYFELSGLPTISIDTGLYIDSFPEHKQPGVFVRRINGKDEASDKEMLDYYIYELNKHGGSSEGCWKIAITFMLSLDEVYTASYNRETFFTTNRCIEFSEDEPLNSIQLDKKTNKYLAQMTPQEKKNVQRELFKYLLMPAIRTD
jgi:inosine/xanthosine triphosphate pyrophosphatase family protein